MRDRVRPSGSNNEISILKKEIEKQREQLADLSRRLEVFEELMCADHPTAEVCH